MIKLSISQVLTKINNNIPLLNIDQLNIIKVINAKQWNKLKYDEYKSIYNIYRYVNHKLITIKAKQWNLKKTK